MPKYWVKNYFAHGSFPEVGQKQMTEGKKKRERLNDGNNNGQATHGARMEHASRLGQLLISSDYKKAQSGPGLRKGTSFFIKGQVSWGKSAIYIHLGYLSSGWGLKYSAKCWSRLK